jgi:hypothetical protein
VHPIYQRNWNAGVLQFLCQKRGKVRVAAEAALPVTRNATALFLHGARAAALLIAAMPWSNTSDGT